jgi:hypothetical protein
LARPNVGDVTNCNTLIMGRGKWLRKRGDDNRLWVATDDARSRFPRSLLTDLRLRTFVVFSHAARGGTLRVYPLASRNRSAPSDFAITVMPFSVW